MEKSSQGGMSAMGLFIAIGLAIGGYFVGQTMYNAKVALNTAEAKGLAERRVKADRANWQVGFTSTGKSRSDVPRLYNESEKTQEKIVGILKDLGFSDDEIEIGVLDYYQQEFRDGLSVDQRSRNGSHLRTTAPSRGRHRTNRERATGRVS